MEANGQVTLDIECGREDGDDATVDEIEAQKTSFGSSSLFYDPLPRNDDIGLLSGMQFQCDGVQEFVWSDDDPDASRLVRGKRMKTTPVFSGYHVQDQQGMASFEDCFVSLCPCPGAQQLFGESYNAAVHAEATPVTVAARGFRSNESTSSNAMESRRRRAKIAEGIRALEENTPQSGKGTRESVLDDAIDYIKYLKLQLLALGQSRLGGDPGHYPFVHLEGFGHYVVHDEMGSESLEEMMGHLMDSNMPAAIRLLESKGLELLPVSSADLILRAGASFPNNTYHH
ncbi:uncharacterized protein LOC144711641 [Wolffia australiana]